MKAKWKHVLFGILCAAAVTLTGCTQNNGNPGNENQKISGEDSAVESGDAQTENARNDEDNMEEKEKEIPPEEIPIRAVYLKNNSGGELFVDLEHETPFFGTIPDVIEDEEGNALSPDALKHGDVYLLYGDQIMMQSYPGQYPGITRMVRQEEESQTYIDKYQEYLERFCPEPDTSQPPELSVSYSQPEALVTASVTRGGYQWERKLENGEAEQMTTDAACILEWTELADVTLTEKTGFRLLFTYEPQSVEVRRWPVSEWREPGTGGETSEGETVKVEKGEEGFGFEGEAGYVYQVIGTWLEGKAEYGFYTRQNAE